MILAAFVLFLLIVVLPTILWFFAAILAIYAADKASKKKLDG